MRGGLGPFGGGHDQDPAVHPDHVDVLMTYGFTEANTTYGVIGVKTWIYRGDIYEAKRRQPAPVGTSVF